MNRKKKLMASATLAAAVMMASASVAYACVTFAGKLTVTTPLTTGGDGSQVVGTGSSHAYCPGYEPTTAAEAGNGTRVRVDVEGSSVTKCVGKLDADSSSVNNVVHIKQIGDLDGAPFNYSSSTSKWVMNDGTGCFRPGSLNLQTVDITVDTAGSGSAEFDLGGMLLVNGANDASMVCVGYSGSQEGIIAPLRVVSL